MLNSITTPNSNRENQDQAWPWTTGVMLIFTFFVIVFGLLPDANLFWSHCRVAEWAVLLCIIFLFIKNWWLKGFLLWNLINHVIVFLTLPKQAGAGAFVAFYYIFLFVVFYQILDNILDKRHTRFIVNGLCVIALLQTFYIIFQHNKMDPFFRGMMGSAGYNSMDVKDLVVGTWGHTNFAGAYLAASIPLFLRKQWFWFIPFLALAIFWGRSWGAVASCGIGVIFWALFAVPGKFKIAVIAAIIIGAVSYGSVFEKRQFNPFKSDRTQYLNPTLDMITMKPFVGWGLSQFKPAFYSIKKHVLKRQIKRTHAHFEFVEHIFETGIIGAVPIIGFMLFVLIIFLRYKTALSISAMSGIVVIAVNSCSSFILRTPLAWIFLIYLIIVMKEAQNNANTLYGK